MSASIETLNKIAKLESILESAQILSNEGLINEAPTDVVKRYVNNNPDINEYLNGGDKACNSQS